MLRYARLNPQYGIGECSLEDSGQWKVGAREPRAAPRGPSAGELAALRRWLEGFLEQSGHQLPHPPGAALEILEVAGRRETTLEELAALLEREPLLAGEVLQLANSPTYRGETANTTLWEALRRIGGSNARELVMEAAMRLTVVRAPGYESALEAVRRHCAAVASVARLVARHTPMEAENAFLAGLMHDVGLMVGLVALAAWEKHTGLTEGLTAERWQVLVEAHERLGVKALEAWGAPPALTLAVGGHHHLTMHGHAHPMIAVLMVAEHLANAAGWELLHVPHGCEAVSQRDSNCAAAPIAEALAALKLTPRHLELIERQAAPVLKALVAQFRDA